MIELQRTTATGRVLSKPHGETSAIPLQDSNPQLRCYRVAASSALHWGGALGAASPGDILVLRLAATEANHPVDPVVFREDDGPHMASVRRAVELAGLHANARRMWINPIDILYAGVDTTYIKSSTDRENEMTNQEAQDTIRQMLADWDNLTDEQRAEAQTIAAEQAASRYAEVLFSRAIGLDLDWATGEFIPAIR